MNYIPFSVFISKKPVIGMLHVLPLAGEPGYTSVDAVVHHALDDAYALEKGGVDGIIIENWYENSTQSCVTQRTASCFYKVLHHIVPKIHIPWGINVLNNDYVLAFSLAKHFQADFVQLDVFVDAVKSAYTYGDAAKKHPFIIHPEPLQIAHVAHQSGDIPFIVFIQPKHYVMLCKEKTLLASALEAKKYGASAVIVTKATGVAPELQKIHLLKTAFPSFPVGIGSGVTSKTVGQFLSVGDFCIVGTALKHHGLLTHPVDSARVQNFMKHASILRRKNLL